MTTHGAQCNQYQHDLTDAVVLMARPHWLQKVRRFRRRCGRDFRMFYIRHFFT